MQDLVLSTAPEEGWRRSGLSAYRHFLDNLVQEADLRRIRYFLAAWPGPELPPAAITRAAEDSFMTTVTPLPEGLPPFYNGSYREELDHLSPWSVTSLTWPCTPPGSYSALGTCTLMHRLLLMPFPLALSVDVETLSVDKAQFRLQSAYNGLYAQLNQQSRFGGKDAKSEEAFRAVESTLKIMEAGERLHMVRLAVLVKAPTVAKLREYGAYIRNTLATHMRLRLEVGQQKESLKLFTAMPPAEINVDVRPAPVLSGGVGVMMPFGLRSRSETAGILFGVDKNSGNPVFYDGWRRSAGEGGKPFHATVLGRTGSGKTFLMQTLFHRLALVRHTGDSDRAGGAFQEIGGVAGRGRELQQGSIRHSVRQPAGYGAAHPTGPDDARAEATGAAAILRDGRCRSRSDLGRRVFTNAELGALDEALREIYEPIWGTSITPAHNATPGGSVQAAGRCTRVGTNYPGRYAGCMSTVCWRAPSTSLPAWTFRSKRGLSAST